MMKSVRGEKITRDGRANDLSSLMAGDNLVIGDQRTVVQAYNECRDLIQIVTINAHSPNDPLNCQVFQTQYFSTKGMIKDGMMVHAETRIIKYPSAFCLPFYQKHLIQEQPMEAVAQA